MDPLEPCVREASAASSLSAAEPVRERGTNRQASSRHASECECGIPVFAKLSVFIPPRTQTGIMCKIRAHQPEQWIGKHVVVSNYLLDRPGTAAGWTTDIVRERGVVGVSVVNLSAMGVIIPRGTKLGNLHLADNIVPMPDASGIGAVRSVVPQECIESKSEEPVQVPVLQIDPKLKGVARQKMEAFLRKWSHLLLPDDATPTVTRVTSHTIELTPEAQPFKLRPHRHSTAEKEIINRTVDKLMGDGSIRRSSSPYSSPIVVVTKKDGRPRMCVDFRKLNQQTVIDSYPLPNVGELLERSGGSSYYSSLDLISGYYQVPIAEKDVHKTAFVTERGLFEWLVMPFGLVNAPATFQRLMDVITSSLPPELVLIYLDDLLICSKTIEEHIEHLEKVFSVLSKAGLSLKASKCFFALSEARFLGHVVGKDGVRPDPEKVSAVLDFKIDNDQSRLRSFLGLSGYYRRYIKGYADIARPLHQLMRTKHGPGWHWTEEHQKAVDTLKQRLTTAPVLWSPTLSDPFVLTTDASNTGLGAVLSQQINGELKPVIYLSRQLTPTEQNYSVTERECLAVVWAVGKLHHWLHNNRRFTLVTDHNSLVWLQRSRSQNGKLCRWALTLSDYLFHVIYKPGKHNRDADALSRAHSGSVRTGGASQALIADPKAYLGRREGLESYPDVVTPSDYLNNTTPLGGGKTTYLNEDEWKEIQRLQSIQAGMPWKPVDRTHPARRTQMVHHSEHANLDLLPGTRRSLESGLLKPPPEFSGIPSYQWSTQVGNESTYSGRGSTYSGTRDMRTPALVRPSTVPSGTSGRPIGKCTVPFNVDRGQSERDGFQQSPDGVAPCVKDMRRNVARVSEPVASANHMVPLVPSSMASNAQRPLSSTTDQKPIQPSVIYEIQDKRSRVVDGILEGYQSWKVVPEHRVELEAAQAADPYLSLVLRVRNGLPLGPVSDRIADNEAAIVDAKECFVDNGILYHLTRIKRQGNKDEETKDTWKVAIALPQRDVPAVLKAYHDHIVSGAHSGIARTYGKLVERYWWRGMLTDIKDYVTTCSSCQFQKTPARRPTVAKMARRVPTYPWEITSIDVLSGLPRSESGNLKVLVVNDVFSRYVRAYAIPDETSATVARCLVKHICIFGCPRVILSDQAMNFVSSLMRDLYKLFGVYKIRTTGYHPMSNGITERFNATLISTIKMYLDSKKGQRDWDAHLDEACYAYNLTPNPTTKFSPHEILFGVPARVPVDLFFLPCPDDASLEEHISYHDYLNSVKYELMSSWQVVQHNLRKAGERYEGMTGTKPLVSYSEHDLVLLYSPFVPTGKSRKLSTLWSGPYEIIKKLNSVNYVIRLQHVSDPKYSKVVHALRLKLYKRRSEPPVVSDTDQNVILLDPSETKLAEQLSEPVELDESELETGQPLSEPVQYESEQMPAAMPSRYSRRTRKQVDPGQYVRLLSDCTRDIIKRAARRENPIVPVGSINQIRINQNTVYQLLCNKPCLPYELEAEEEFRGGRSIGYGVKTLEDISAGQLVAEYVGVLLNEEQYQNKMIGYKEKRDATTGPVGTYIYGYPKHHSHVHMHPEIKTIGRMEYIDATTPEGCPIEYRINTFGYAPLINHKSRGYNLLSYARYVHDSYRVLFFSRHAIKAGSFLSFKYGTTDKQLLEDYPWLKH